MPSGGARRPAAAKPSGEMRRRAATGRHAVGINGVMNGALARHTPTAQGIERCPLARSDTGVPQGARAAENALHSTRRRTQTPSKTSSREARREVRFHRFAPRATRRDSAPTALATQIAHLFLSIAEYAPPVRRFGVECHHFDPMRRALVGDVPPLSTALNPCGQRANHAGNEARSSFSVYSHVSAPCAPVRAALSY